MPNRDQNSTPANDLIRQIEHWTCNAQGGVIFIEDQLELYARSIPNWPVVRANLRELHRVFGKILHRNQLLGVELNQHLNCIPGDHFESRGHRDCRPTRSLNEPR